MTVFLIASACVILLVVLMLLAEYIDSKKTKENDLLDAERFAQEMANSQVLDEPLEDSVDHAEALPETPVVAPAKKVVKKVAKKAAKKTVKAEPAPPAAKSKTTYKKKSPKA